MASLICRAAVDEEADYCCERCARRHGGGQVAAVIRASKSRALDRASHTSRVGCDGVAGRAGLGGCEVKAAVRAGAVVGEDRSPRRAINSRPAKTTDSRQPTTTTDPTPCAAPSFVPPPCEPSASFCY